MFYNFLAEGEVTPTEECFSLPDHTSPHLVGLTSMIWCSRDIELSGTTYLYVLAPQAVDTTGLLIKTHMACRLRC